MFWGGRVLGFRFWVSWGFRVLELWGFSALGFRALGGFRVLGF